METRHLPTNNSNLILPFSVHWCISGFFFFPLCNKSSSLFLPHNLLTHSKHELIFQDVKHQIFFFLLTSLVSRIQINAFLIKTTSNKIFLYIWQNKSHTITSLSLFPTVGIASPSILQCDSQGTYQQPVRSPIIIEVNKQSFHALKDIHLHLEIRRSKI